MIESARRLRQSLVRSDYVPLFALIVSIQGTVLISQAAAALMIPAAELGVIRTFESVFAVMVLVAGFGAPALAMREMAIPGDHHDRGRALRNLVLLPAIGAVVTMIGAAGLTIAGAKFIAGPALALALGMGLLIAVNLVRLTAAVAQGLQIARKVWLFAAGSAALCAAIQLGGALQGSLTGWIIGRLVGEGALLAGLLLAMRGTLPPVAWRDRIDPAAVIRMMGRATTINAAFILRMLADAAPIVLLGLVIPAGADRAVVGYFGIGTLLVTLGLLPISVLSQQSLPVLASATSAQAARQTSAQMLRRLLAASTFALVILIAIIYLLAVLGHNNFAQAGPMISVLMLSVPLRGLSAGVSTMMLADGRYGPSLWVNLAELVAIMMVFSVGASRAPELGIAVGASLAGALVSIVGMKYFQAAVARRNVVC